MQRRPPNIVYIHTQDLGRCCRLVRDDTPARNRMRLARQGVLLRHAFASAPSCAPSRAALGTGQYLLAEGVIPFPPVKEA